MSINSIEAYQIWYASTSEFRVYYMFWETNIKNKIIYLIV